MDELYLRQKMNEIVMTIDEQFDDIVSSYPLGQSDEIDEAIRTTECFVDNAREEIRRKVGAIFGELVGKSAK